MTEDKSAIGSKARTGKGFIFSLDATIAVFLLVFVIMASAFLLAQSENDPLSQLQASRMGKDALAILDNAGDLQSFNATRIDAKLASILPQGNEVHITVETYGYENATFYLLSQADYGPEVPSGITVYGARRDFVDTKNSQVSNYSIARAFIWTG
jgi:hypothetical protein